MVRHSYHRLLFGGIVLASLLLAGSAQADAPRPPNIVFFLCDDLGSGDVAALGSRDIHTPEIDRLFARGTRLTRHWAGSAVCAPSRCVLMTGMHPGHAVVRSNREVKPEGQAPMPAGTVTLAHLLRTAGYATGGFGKWGLGAPGSVSDPLASGFDRFYGYNCQRQAHSYYPDHLFDDRQRVALDGKTYSADLIASKQLEFLRTNANRPFFLYVPTTVPHLALEVPADEPSLTDYAKHFDNEEPYRGGKGYVPCERPLATFAAMVTRMDREVGRIVRLLDELKLTDDTIFVFTSDNGATAPGTGGIDTARLGSNGALRDWKGSPYEGGLRVPTAIVWPGRIQAGRSIDVPTGCEDWLPTLLDLAGLRDHIPAGLDGVSLTSMLCGTADPPVRTLYRELTERQWQTAIDGRWKAVRRGKGNPRNKTAEAHPTELYDLQTDPSEAQDVAAAHPDVVERMEAILDREHVPHPDWPLPFADTASRKAGRAATPRKQPPSVLVILSDDQRADTIQALGNPHLRTPAVDALVARGTVCDRAYCMGSMQGAVCVPSRAMMLSGRSLFRIDEQLRGCDTWPEAFGRAGYRTFLTGKWHNGAASATRCFAEGSSVFLGGMHDQFSVPVVSFAGHGQPVKKEPSRTHSSELFGNAAESFVQSLGDEPFFAWVAFTAPHDPRQPPDGFRERFVGCEPPPPENFLPEHPFDNGELKIRDEKLLGWPRSREQISAALADYYACIEGMDAQIGRVIAALDAKGRLDDTIILFTSDHGLALGSHGLLGKQNLYEHSMRPPAVIAGPGVPVGRRTDALCYLYDLTATVGDLAGVPAPEQSEGKSLTPVLRDNQPGLRDELLLAYRNVQRALVTPEWKLIEYPVASKTELFQLVRDPDERVNRADDPAEAPRRADLEARLKAARQAVGDPVAAVADPRPNVILFLADDLGYGELGCYGHAAAITPNLDRFAAEGLRLTDCHSAGSVCSPSRSALLTGRTPYRNGVFTWIPEDSPIHLRTSEHALPKLLREAGYDTCHVGKWHLNGRFNSPDQPQPSDHGYSWWLATQNNAAPSHAFPTNFVRNGMAIGKADDYSAPFIAQEAIGWLKEKRDPQKPFFLAVWTHEPHYPIASEERYEQLHAGIADREERTYRANITQLDDAFGQLMKTVDDMQLTDSTLVFFSSDNGPEGDGDKGPGRGLAGGLRGRKRSMYEGGHRVPGLVRWPGKIQPGTKSGAPVIGSDVFPTMLAAAGVKPPAGRTLDGTSLLPLLAGGAVHRQVPLYWRWGGKVAYREGDWKIVVDEALEKPELYDLATDRNESTNLAAREADRLAAMMARLRAYTAEVEAEGPDWWRTEPLNGRKKNPAATRKTTRKANRKDAA